MARRNVKRGRAGVVAKEVRLRVRQGLKSPKLISKSDGKKKRKKNNLLLLVASRDGEKDCRLKGR